MGACFTRTSLVLRLGFVLVSLLHCVMARPEAPSPVQEYLLKFPETPTAEVKAAELLDHRNEYPKALTATRYPDGAFAFGSLPETDASPHALLEGLLAAFLR